MCMMPTEGKYNRYLSKKFRAIMGKIQDGKNLALSTKLEDCETQELRNLNHDHHDFCSPDYVHLPLVTRRLSNTAFEEHGVIPIKQNCDMCGGPVNSEQISGFGFRPNHKRWKVRCNFYFHYPLNKVINKITKWVRKAHGWVQRGQQL